MAQSLRDKVLQALREVTVRPHERVRIITARRRARESPAGRRACAAMAGLRLRLRDPARADRREQCAWHGRRTEGEKMFNTS